MMKISLGEKPTIYNQMFYCYVAKVIVPSDGEVRNFETFPLKSGVSQNTTGMSQYFYRKHCRSTFYNRNHSVL